MPVRSQQQSLPLGFVRNRGLFANHWFDNRLRLEPEWRELAGEAREALARLEELWRRENVLATPEGVA